ncbi:uroporphyrinogen-III C-methyltransferase [Nocardioides jejuensis]|uniref:Uroporphyrinogen-III C-methyltransferase n=1 Tax=Nocardioides jejuensis TaxID=2502782 RepID=A0A4R1CH52_9ACTN|nr:uroporphyrinogen-III C-methyltransferase [Nocardioides jejuensis]TCJ30724.1 uroporphyrinogen-III C-methyltransferase [Nocardioides jejuensis]
MADLPTYPVGLRLAGRKVLVVGGGHVAQRRIPTLIAAGADVHVVAREATMAIEGMSDEITLAIRDFEPADLDGAWYAIAATDNAETNAEVAAAAEERRIFCVRSDDASEATAWTPAVGRHDGLTIAVLANREPRRSAAVRDQILEALRDGTALRTPSVESKKAGVVLVGGGPGDPDLVTIAARNAIASADVVVADRLAPRELLADLAPDVELIDVAKLPRGRYASQEFINEVIVDRALAGKRVVRFKGGDNFVFGRGYEEIIACNAAGVPVEIIPGLSSSISVPARAGIPVTHRGVTHEFTVISGHIPPGHPDSLVNWAAAAQMQGTLVLLMAVENAPKIAAALVDGGRPADTPVAVIMDGTMPDERTVLSTLGTLADDLVAEGVTPPAIIVVGEVVAVANPERYGR